MNEEYNVPVEQPEQQPSQDLGVPVIDPNKPLSPQTAGDRANRADFGLSGKVDKTKQDYYDSFINGQESAMRGYIVNKLYEQADQRRQDIVTKLAAQKGSALSSEDFDNIDRVINDPNSVIEDHYAQRRVNSLKWPLGQEESNWLQDANQQMPEQLQKDINIGTEYTAKTEFWRSVAQDMAENSERQSWPGWAVDRLKEVSGLYTFIKPHLPGTSWFNLPGRQREEARRKLMMMPYEQMKTEGMAFVNQLKQDNPAMAADFARDMVGMSSDQILMENILPIIQPGLEVGAVASIASRVATMNASRTAVRQMLTSAASGPETAAAASGNLKEATMAGAIRSITSRLRKADPIDDAVKDMPYIFRIGRQQLIDNGGLDLAGTQALVEKQDELIRTFPNMVESLTKGERTPVLLESQEARDAVQQEVINDNRTLSSRIVNTSQPYKIPYSDNLYVDLILGKNTQEPFGSKGHAGRVAAEHGLSGFDIVGGTDIKYPDTFENQIARLESASGGPVTSPGIKSKSTALGDRGPINPEAARLEQVGSGYYIIKPIPLKESGKAMREYYATLSSDRTPEGGVLNSFLSRFRTPNDTLSEWQNRNRQAATFSTSVIEKYAYDQAEDIRKLSPTLPFGPAKQKWNDFERVVNNARSKRDPDTGKMGYTFKNIPELQFNYMQTIGRLPDTQEVSAYFAFKRIQEVDHALRTISMVKNKVRHGTMTHQFWTVGKDGERVLSPEFDAVPNPGYPHGSRNDTLIVVGDKPGEEVITRVGARGNRAERYARRADNGEYKVARIYAPEYNPLSGYGKINDTHHAIWIMSKNMSTKPIDWTKQLPWRGGGHFQYKANQHIKQIDIKKETLDGVDHYYAVGTNTLMPVVNGVEGRGIIRHFEQIRNLLQTKTTDNLAAAKDIVENTLHMDWKEVYQMFRPLAKRNARTGQMTPGTKPLFNLTEPFQLVNTNDNLINIDKAGLAARYPREQFTDATKHGSLNQQFQTEFTKERDAEQLFTLNNRGTIENPAYSWEPAPLLDAIPTMNRAMTKIANTTLMEDYKLSSVETWLREAAPGLRAKESELQSAPLYWFHHAEFTKGWNPIKAAELETARAQIQQFIGQVSETDAVLHTWTQRLADSVFETSPRLASWIDPVKTASFLRDPTRVMRAITFHKSMGLFSIPQILVQGQTYVNILAIAGFKKAGQGTVAALMHQFSRINPSEEMLNYWDRHASKFGWRPGEWKEARQAMMESGFDKVGKEYALTDDPMSDRTIRTKWGQFFDFAALPFTEGEKNVRYGAWYTAYKEFRDTKPTGPLSNADKLKMLDRASILNGNMNRASNAMYQRSWAALPAQFFTYTIRQAELMWGNRLTPVEKARLLAVNAAMYGLPIGLGITGLPSDILRQNAIQNGYNPGSNYVETLVTEGIPSTILALANSGQYYNIGERYGNQGLTTLRDLWYGDKAIWEMALGASGSTLGSIFEAFDPFRQKIMSTLRGDPDGFNVMPEHIYQVAKEANSVNTTWRSVTAALTGKWMTKKGEPLLNGITPLQSVLMGLTGLQPQEATDYYLMSSIMKTEKTLQQWAEGRFIQEYHRALQSYDNKDPSNGNAFMTNAFSYMELYIPDDEKDKVLSSASKNWETVIDRVKDSFGTKHVPPWLKNARREQYIQGLK